MCNFGNSRCRDVGCTSKYSIFCSFPNLAVARGLLKMTPKDKLLSIIYLIEKETCHILGSKLSCNKQVMQGDILLLRKIKPS